MHNSIKNKKSSPSHPRIANKTKRKVTRTPSSHLHTTSKVTQSKAKTSRMNTTLTTPSPSQNIHHNFLQTTTTHSKRFLSTITTTTPEPSPITKPKLEIQRFHTSKRFSEAVCYGSLVHLAGQLADDCTKDISNQTQQTLDNIDRFLADAGSHKSKILSVTIYLKDMGDYNAMNEVWDKWVAEGTAPARTCVEAKLYAPEVLVEMTAVAVRDV